MKKYAATLLSVFLVCGCSNITPNNEKVEVSQEKLENMTALYTGLAEANETIDNKSKMVYGPIMRMVQKNLLRKDGLSKILSHWRQERLQKLLLNIRV